MVQNIPSESYAPSNIITGKGWEIFHEGVTRSMEEKDMNAWEYGGNSKSNKA